MIWCKLSTMFDFVALFIGDCLTWALWHSLKCTCAAAKSKTASGTHHCMPIDQLPTDLYCSIQIFIFVLQKIFFPIMCLFTTINQEEWESAYILIKFLKMWFWRYFNLCILPWMICFEPSNAWEDTCASWNVQVHAMSSHSPQRWAACRSHRSWQVQSQPA
jgi:hypothetical protein